MIIVSLQFWFRVLRIITKGVARFIKVRGLRKIVSWGMYNFYVQSMDCRYIATMQKKVILLLHMTENNFKYDFQAWLWSTLLLLFLF